MALSLVKSFSILVASGNGQRCNGLRAALRSHLISEDETGFSKVFLHKNGRDLEQHRQDYVRISKEVGGIVRSALEGVPSYFFGSDQRFNPVEVN